MVWPRLFSSLTISSKNCWLLLWLLLQYWVPKCFEKREKESEKVKNRLQNPLERHTVHTDINIGTDRSATREALSPPL